MPLLVPNENETKDAFLARCMGDESMTAEYQSNGQRYAVCSVQWGKKATNMKLDVTEIRNVEIAKAGKWNPSTGGKLELKQSDLDEMITNFNARIVDPYLNLDHDDKLTGRVKDALKVVALGFVSSLRRVGDTLVADFKQVPVKVAELIKAGMLKQRSIEFFRSGFVADGKTYSNVLRAVSFFGASIPAVNGLSDDFEVLLKSTDHAIASGDGPVTTILQFSKGESMNIEIAKEEYASLLKQQAMAEKLSVDMKAVSDKVAEFSAIVENLKKEKSAAEEQVKALTAKVAEHEKVAAEALKAEAESYVSAAIKVGAILPKFKDKYVDDYMTASKSADALKLFKEDMEGRAKIDLSQIKDPQHSAEIDASKLKSMELVENDDASDEVNDLIEKRMKANNSTFEAEAAKLGLNVSAESTIAIQE